MAAKAVRKHALRAVRALGGSATAEEVYEIVGWWTPDTVREALDELVDGGLLRSNVAGVFHLTEAGGR